MEKQEMKNDGTDIQKNDGSGPSINATTRSCEIKLTNKTGGVITNAVLTHTTGSTNNVINEPTLAHNASSALKSINYETGFLADFDYWNVSFKIGSDIYDTPYNDRCNIAFEDAGQVVECIITPYASDFNLQVKMPKSSSCNFIIKKK